MTKPTGLTDSQLSEIEKVLSTVLHSKKQKAVYVFGSRATGKHRQYSDLDLWIESDPELTTKDLQDLQEKFEESDLPIKIDIVTPTNCLETYRENIQKSKRVWF